MPPSKPSVLSPSKFSTTTSSSSLDSPISLLWAHQLRREHGLLLSRIDHLTTLINSSHISPAQAKKIVTQAEKAEARFGTAEAGVAKLLKENDILKKELRESLQGLEVIEEAQSVVELRVLGCEDEVRETMEKFKMWKTGLEDRIERMRTEISTKIDREGGDLRSWIDWVKALEAKVDGLHHGVEIVKDSMEERQSETHDEGMVPRLQVSDILMSSQISAQHSSQDAPHAAVPVIAISHASDLLNSPNSDDKPGASSFIGDIDLDEPISPLNPAPERVTLAGDSLVMLPDTTTTQLFRNRALSDLKQGKFESWSRYFSFGDDWIKSVTKRREAIVVEAFVEGIYDETFRKECEAWLDERGWAWANVKYFVEEHVQNSESTGSASRKMPTAVEMAYMPAMRLTVKKRLSGATPNSSRAERPPNLQEGGGKGQSAAQRIGPRRSTRRQEDQRRKRPAVQGALVEVFRPEDSARKKTLPKQEEPIRPKNNANPRKKEVKKPPKKRRRIVTPPPQGGFIPITSTQSDEE